MKNLLKTFALLIAVLTLIPATHALASQSVSSESEPNNSMSTANQVTRNLTTPAQAADGSLQKWDFKYIPAKTVAIDASVYFYYVYPVLPANETE